MRQISDTNIAVLTARRKLSCMQAETTTALRRLSVVL